MLFRSHRGGGHGGQRRGVRHPAGRDGQPLVHDESPRYSGHLPQPVLHRGGSAGLPGGQLCHRGLRLGRYVRYRRTCLSAHDRLHHRRGPEPDGEGPGGVPGGAHICPHPLGRLPGLPRGAGCPAGGGIEHPAHQPRRVGSEKGRTRRRRCGPSTRKPWPGRNRRVEPWKCL